MNIYLDIDGSIIDYGGNPAEHLKEFLEFVLKDHTPHWLSTQCKGDAQVTQNYLQYCGLSKELLALTAQVAPTNWNRNKTEAIDYSEPFFWLDDYLFDQEWQVLSDKKLLDSWIPIDLEEQPDALMHAMWKIKRA